AQGQSLDSLPQDDPGAAWARGHPGGVPHAGITKGQASERLAQDIEALKQEQAAQLGAAPAPTPTPTVEKLTLQEERDRARVAAIANGVSLDDHAAGGETPSGSATDYDTSAAKAELGRAAGLV